MILRDIFEGNGESERFESEKWKRKWMRLHIPTASQPRETFACEGDPEGSGSQ